MPIRHRLAVTATAIAALGAATVGSLAIAQSNQMGQTQELKVEARKPKLTLVKVHADWCPACKAAETPWAAAQKELVADDILFVRVNRTDNATSRQAAFHLATLDLANVWREFGNKTGQVVLVETATGKVLETFNGRTAGSSFTDAIRKHL